MIGNPSSTTTKSAEEIELENNKNTLSELVARRSAYLQQDGENLDQKNNAKKNFIEEFLAPYLENFGMLKKSWSKGDIDKNTGAIADYLGGKIDSMMEKYLPPSSREKDNFDKFSNKILRTEDPNKIKLESGENLIDQLKENGFNLEDLKKINNKINMTTIINPFSKDNQSIPIELPDGRKLRLDVKQYAEDLVEYNQLQKNTDANAKDSSQIQQIELSGILDLYGKHKFNEKFPQEGAKIPLSKEEEKSIENFQANAIESDKKREETLKKFAETFGFSIPENKSKNTSEKPENKALEIGQSSETHREAINPTTEKSWLRGILKNSNSGKTPDLARGVSWAYRVDEELNVSEKGSQGRS
jgi:hypothetical protein